MSPLPKVANAFERRKERAELLARQSEAGRTPLLFAAGLYHAQAELAHAIEKRQAQLSGFLEHDLPAFNIALDAVLRFLASAFPRELAREAAQHLEGPREELLARLHAFWSGATPSREDYLSRALLRPYLETLAALEKKPRRARAESVTGSHCAFCGSLPWIAWRRAATSADGAQRYLGCPLCGSEWVANRLICPSCSEGDPKKLPSFQSESYPAVRIEACESCKTYVKSLDLTIDARLIPEVDDLGSLALDVWAIEKGFTHLEPGLAGV